METKELYREILNEHNLNPAHKKDADGATLSLNGVNPSCGDNITLNFKIDNGIITDGWFTGTGCAVSQASADMMLDLVIGKKQDEALRLGDIFMDMIKGTAAPAALAELDEAAALQDISKMPARVKCAVLGWRTMKEMFANAKTSAAFGNPHCEADGKIGH
ncbi:MAG: Fe-S cluster assembly sulfur transfer protein SufU [Treponema sp.]